MAARRTKRRFSARALVSSVIACLFLLQGFVLAASPTLGHPISGAAGAVMFAASGGEICDGRSDGAPRQHHDDPTKCCLSCVAAKRDASPLADAATLGGAPLAQPARYYRLARALRGEPIPRAGVRNRASSPRAPPSFS